MAKLRTNWKWLTEKHGRDIIHGKRPDRAGKKPPRRKPRASMHGAVIRRPDLVMLRNREVAKQAI